MTDPGKTYVYSEDDWTARVEMLQDLSTDEEEAYELRVISTLRPSRLYRPTLDGTVFRCSCVKKYENRIWRLAVTP